MLVLSRRTNESIIIGKDIKVTVLSVEGDKIRLGIEAPKTMRVFREELVRQTVDANKMALGASFVSFDRQAGGDSEHPKQITMERRKIDRRKSDGTFKPGVTVTHENGTTRILFRDRRKGDRRKGER